MTPQIHLHVLASGSKGNAAVVEGPAGSVLIDDGIARRTLLARASKLGVNMGDVRAVLLTHEHTDHVSGLPVFANHFDGPLFATAGTISARECLSQLPFEVINHTDALELCGMHVTVFPTSHDVADPVGFRFATTDENGELALAVTARDLEAHAALGRQALIALAGACLVRVILGIAQGGSRGFSGFVSQNGSRDDTHAGARAHPLIWWENS